MSFCGARVQGAKDLQHIQYRELGKGLQVWGGGRFGWSRNCDERKAPASPPESGQAEGGRYESWCKKGTGDGKEGCGSEEKR